MRFYDALQMDPSVLKQEMRKAETPAYRRKMQLAIATRSILIVLFSIMLIAPVGPLFGQENSCMAVVLLCVLLSVRFVDFGYCMRDALIYLAVTLLLLVFAPNIAAAVGPFLGFFIHFAAVFLILTITSNQPEMGNGGLYTFAYILLVGNPVSGELLWKRVLLTLLGYSLCALVYFTKHRKKNAAVRFRELFKQFHLSLKHCRWQLQMALGLSAFLALGSFLQLERMMWAGFACASMLGCYTNNTETAVRERLSQRVVGVIVGSGLFFIVYQLLPTSLHPILGPLGGVCFGFCVDYRYKTALNCFGALMMATGLYGLQGSVLLRIVNNIVGAAFGYGFAVLYQKLVGRHFEPDNQ